MAELTREARSLSLVQPFESFIHLLFPQVNADDTLRLTHPILTASGELVDRIFVAKGTLIRIPIVGINRSEALWGTDADKFDPNRWLDSNHEGGRWTEIQGYKHLLTFGNGPRMCVGRNFAINEIKVGSLSRLPGLFPLVFIIPSWAFRSSCLF